MDLTLRRADDVVFQQLDDEVLVLRPGSADVLHLNRTASDVWELLSEPTSVPELVGLLAEGYQVAPEQVHQDVAPLLERLLEAGVVRAVTT